MAISSTKELWIHQPVGIQELNLSPSNFNVGNDPSKALCLGIEDDLTLSSFPKFWDNGPNNRMVFQINGLSKEKHFWILHKDSANTNMNFSWFQPRESVY